MLAGQGRVARQQLQETFLILLLQFGRHRGETKVFNQIHQWLTALAVFIRGDFLKQRIKLSGRKRAFDRKWLRRRIHRQVAERELNAIEKMLQNRGVPINGMVVSEGAVKNAALAEAARPTDRQIAITKTPAHRAAIGFVRHIQRHQDTAVLTQAAWANAINLIAELKIFAVKRGVERMRGIDDLDRPGAAGVPRMTIKKSAHHVGGFRPVIKIIRGRVNADHAFAAFDKRHQTLAQRKIFESELRGAGEKHGIKLPQILRRQSCHLCTLNRCKSARLFAEQRHRLGRVWNRAMLITFGTGENQKLARLLRFDRRLRRQRLLDPVQIFGRNLRERQAGEKHSMANAEKKFRWAIWHIQF
ncbi:MAG: hypothetical protein ALAOOOJD_03419 [bacterium]|nr:hypothetical protein [bacterium]